MKSIIFLILVSFIWLQFLSTFNSFLIFWVIHFFNISINYYMIMTKEMILEDKMKSYLIMMHWFFNIMIFLSFQIEKNNYKFLNLMMLIMSWGLTIFFSTNNFFIFYFSFEMTVIPIMLMILGWGYQVERIKASVSMFFYLFLSSLPLIFFFSYYSIQLSSSNMLKLSDLKLISWLVTIFFLFPFLVKLPIFLFHNWLTLAHVEAPAFASVFLASILLKTGGFGLWKITNLISLEKGLATPLMILIIISLMMMMMQSDFKAWIAFSSIVHMTLVAICIMGSSSLAQSSILVSMFCHAFSSGCMFFFAHLVQYKMFTRNIYLLSSTSLISSFFPLLFIIMTIFNISFPPSINFMSEFFSIMYLVKMNYLIGMILCILLMTSMIIMTIFMYSSILHGKLQFSKFQINNNMILCSMMMFILISLTFFTFLWILF